MDYPLLSLRNLGHIIAQNPQCLCSCQIEGKKLSVIGHQLLDKMAMAYLTSDGFLMAFGKQLIRKCSWNEPVTKRVGEHVVRGSGKKVAATAV